MRKTTIIGVMALAIVTAPWAAVSAADSEKAPDTVNFTLDPAGRADSTTANIDGSQTFDRRYSIQYDGTCNATSSDSFNDGVGYVALAIHSPTAENLVATVSAADFSDSVMFLYCDPFDPANPDQNLVAWDDDDGTGNLSAFSDADGFQIQADTTYWLVISTYSPGETGNLTVDLGGDALFGPAGGVPTPTPQAAPGVPATTPWGLTALMLAFAGVALAILRRRA